MKKNILLGILFLGILNVSAQSNFQSIIESEIVKDKITFEIIGENLNISLDNSEPKEMVESLNLQGGSKQIVINSKFIHPLKYQVSLTNKLVEDELTKAAQDYFSQFIKYISSISSSSFAKPKAKGVVSSARTITLKNPHLIELYALLSNGTHNFFDPPTASDPSRSDLLTAMEAIDNKTVESDVMDRYETIFNNIWEIEKYEDINTSIEENKSILEKIKSKIDELASVISELDDESDDFAASYIAFNSTSIAKNNLALIKNKIEQIKNDYQTFLKKKQELDDKYDTFVKLLDNISNNTYGEDSKETRLDKIIFEKGKRNEVSIYLKIFDYDKKSKALTEKEQKTYTLYLRKYQTFIPVVASGVLYTNLSFETYGTEENEVGETKLTQGKFKDNEIAIGAYLNLYYNNGWNTPVFLQIGVGPSKEKPLLFAGAGMSIGSRISISGGAVFTWAPTLNELSVGDMVTGTTQIEDDIIYKFTNSPKFYLGLSFDLTK